VYSISVVDDLLNRGRDDNSLRKKRQATPPAEDLDAMRDGRRCGRFPEWWLTTNPDDLKRAHDRAKQLIDGDYGAVDWIDWGKPL
jgi:hypothetical protein